MRGPAPRTLERRGTAARVLFVAVCAFALFVPGSIAFAQGALLVALVAWAVALRRGELEGPRGGVAGALALLVGAAVLSAVFGADTWPALRELRSLWVLSPVLVVPAAIATENDRRGVATWLAFGFAASCLFGVAQRIWDVSNLFRIGRVTVSRYLGEEVRITGFFDHPMTFAGQVVVLGAFFVALAPERWLGGWRRALVWALVPLAALALALSFTRSAWVAALGAFALLLARREHGRAAAVVGLFALAAVVAVVAWPTVGERAVSVAHLDELRELRRLEMWGAAIEMNRDYPIFGVGWSRYEELVGSYDAGLRDWSPHAHSNVYQLVAELGWFGFAAFCALWLAAVRALVRGSARDGPAAAALVALVAFHVMGLFEYNFGDSEVIMATLLVVGVGLARPQPAADPASRAGSVPAPQAAVPPTSLTPAAEAGDAGTLAPVRDDAAEERS